MFYEIYLSYKFKKEGMPPPLPPPVSEPPSKPLPPKTIGKGK